VLGAPDGRFNAVIYGGGAVIMKEVVGRSLGL
jgi:hypothetical protein